MATEIERKFLIQKTTWRRLPSDGGRAIRQFYLAVRDGFSTRVRVTEDTHAVLTVKTGSGLSRGEYEYAIPIGDARELEAARIGNVVEKRRYRIDLSGDGLVAEVDAFTGHLAPLVLAEVELPRADRAFPLPDWFGTEVTGDPAYLNARLALCEGPPTAEHSGC